MKFLILFAIWLAPAVGFSHYAIATGDRDRERLHILNELYNASSLSLLELEPGLRVLTIGCGIGLLEIEMAKKVGSSGKVLGTDVSLEQLKIAEDYATGAKAENLEFLQLKVEDIDQIQGRFDRIHCRFVLSHIPMEKTERIIPILYNLLAPNGRLVLEEIATLRSFACDPPNGAYEKWVRINEKQFAAQQSDDSPGEKIASFLQKQGYSFASHSLQPILRTEREKSILSLGVRSVKERLLKMGWISEAEIEDTIDRLEEMEKDPSIFPRYCETKQMVVQGANCFNKSITDDD